MTEAGPDHARGLAALVSGALLLGFAAIFVRWAAPAGSFAVGFYRMAFALPVVAWLARAEGPWDPKGRAWALLAGLAFAADLLLCHLALHRTSAANATMLVGLAPLWVALGSVAFLGTRLRKRFWLALAFALAGAAILGFAKGARLGTGTGELLGALASICYGAYTLLLGFARRRLSARQALFLVALTCAAAFGLGGLGAGEAFHGFPPRSWAALAGVGLVCQVGAWWLITWGLGHLNPNLGAMGLMLQQVATLGLGWLCLGEAVRPLQGAGSLLIMGGIALAAFTPPLSAPETPEAPCVPEAPSSSSSR